MQKPIDEAGTAVTVPVPAPVHEIDEADLPVLQASGLDSWQEFLNDGQKLERGASEKNGPIFRRIRDLMKAPGTRNDLRKKKGVRDAGFKAWLTQHNVPHTRIYQWIKEDEIRTGDRNQPKPKKPLLELATSYESVGGSAVESPELEEINDTKSENPGQSTVTKRFLYGQLEAAEFDRLEKALRLHLNTDNPSDTVLAALRDLHHLFVTTTSLRGELPITGEKHQ